MTDIFSREKRSEIMSKIRGKETKIELRLFDDLVALGFEYQPKGIFGKPDYAHRKRMVAVFFDGCFWHGCPIHYKEPKTDRKYWIPKIKRNRERDQEVTRKLEAEGWTVLRFWEHQINKNPEKVLSKISDSLAS